MSRKASASFSRTLFVTRNGLALKFYVRPCSEKPKLRQLIEERGGEFARPADPDVLRLVLPGDLPPETSKNSLKVEFIHDCVSANKLLPMDSYRVVAKTRQELDEALDIDEVEANDMVCFTRQAEKPMKPRRDYTLEDDKKLIHYIVKKGAYNSVKGRSVWQSMEEVFSGRTWQSLRERYLKRIVKRLEDYHLPDSTYELIKKGCGQWTRQDQVRLQASIRKRQRIIEPDDASDDSDTTVEFTSDAAESVNTETSNKSEQTLTRQARTLRQIATNSGAGSTSNHAERPRSPLIPRKRNLIPMSNNDSDNTTSQHASSALGNYDGTGCRVAFNSPKGQDKETVPAESLRNSPQNYPNKETIPVVSLKKGSPVRSSTDSSSAKGSPCKTNKVPQSISVLIPSVCKMSSKINHGKTGTEDPEQVLCSRQSRSSCSSASSTACNPGSTSDCATQLTCTQESSPDTGRLRFHQLLVRKSLNKKINPLPGVSNSKERLYLSSSSNSCSKSLSTDECSHPEHLDISGQVHHQATSVYNRKKLRCNSKNNFPAPLIELESEVEGDKEDSQVWNESQETERSVSLLENACPGLQAKSIQSRTDGKTRESLRAEDGMSVNLSQESREDDDDDSLDLTLREQARRSSTPLKKKGVSVVEISTQSQDLNNKECFNSESQDSLTALPLLSTLPYDEDDEMQEQQTGPTLEKECGGESQDVQTQFPVSWLSPFAKKASTPDPKGKSADKVQRKTGICDHESQPFGTAVPPLLESNLQNAAAASYESSRVCSGSISAKLSFDKMEECLESWRGKAIKGHRLVSVGNGDMVLSKKEFDTFVSYFETGKEACRRIILEEQVREVLGKRLSAHTRKDTQLLEMYLENNS